MNFIQVEKYSEGGIPMIKGLVKTSVGVIFDGTLITYIFNKPKEEFLKLWKNHICAVGYISLDDENGNHVIINPTNCGIVEIKEADDE